MQRISNDTIYPVILRVPDEKRDLKGREKVRYLSRYARKALQESARNSGVRLTHLQKDEQGAPLPVNGTYWSLSHKSTYVAGIVSRKKIGIDLEQIRPCSDKLFQRIASKKEWSLADSDAIGCFYRFWTAKEAVLKASGVGMRDLSDCRIHRIIDHHNLAINYADRIWIVAHYHFDNHIASVVQNDFSVHWTISSEHTDIPMNPAMA